MSEHEYTPKSKAGKWFNDRLPLLTLGAHLTDYPTPKNLNYWWTFGGILTFCLITQIVTGIVLAMHYVAHADLAFASVEHICLLYTSPSPRDTILSRMPSSA